MNINILGYGIMAKQISALLYLGGHDIIIWNHQAVKDANEVHRQVKMINRTINSSQAGSVRFVNTLAELTNDVTIESLVEDLTIKQNIRRRTEGIVDDNLYFTNTSSYSPTEISPRIGGLHFYNPITLRLVELYSPLQYLHPKADSVIDCLTSLDFNVIKVRPNRGYIGNYLLFSEISTVFKLIENHHYSFSDVNVIYSKLYGDRNILSIIDLIGIDVVYKILQNLHEEDCSIYLPKSFSVAMEKNILGRKNKTSIRSLFE